MKLSTADLACVCVCVCVCEDVGEWSGLTTVPTTDSVYRLKSTEALDDRMIMKT